ncbi:MAG: DUF808 family protein, partial [Flavobacteriales bacterium]
SLGKNMVLALPKLIRVISHVGTVALLLVAGGIFHHIDAVHHLFHGWPGLVVDGLLGALVGSAALVLKRAGLKIRSAVSR